MKYDFFADFYLKSGDAEPRYTVYLGPFWPENDAELEEMGFRYHSNDGYADYLIDDASQEQLESFSREGFESEVMDVLFNGEDFERISISAMEVEVIDDEGNYPPRGVLIGVTFVKFFMTDPFSEVTFTEDYFDKSKREWRYFHTPLKRLKDYFGVITQSAVITKLQSFEEDTQREWTFDELEVLFECGVDEAVEIATKAFYGMKDLDGNPALLHALAVGLAGRNKYEMMTGFLHDVLEDSDYTGEDLYKFGIPGNVVQAVEILTHNKERDTYEEYITGIVASGKELAINVKLNDLRHNILRAQTGNHPEYLKKHLDALSFIENALKSGEKTVNL